MRKTYLAAIVASLTLSAAAVAQQSAPQPQTQTPAVAQQQTTVELTDANLLTFSVAMDAIQQVGGKYESKFKAAETPEQAQQVQSAHESSADPHAQPASVLAEPD